MKELKKSLFNRLQIVFFLVLCCQLTGCRTSATSAEYFSDKEDTVSEVQAFYVDTNKFYYSQLTEFEKEIYDSIFNSKEMIINNNEFFCITGLTNMCDTYFQYIKRAVYAYLYDNPEARIYFYKYGIRTQLSTTHGDNYYDFFIIPHTDDGQYSDFSTEEIRNMLTTLETTTKEFVESLSGPDAIKLMKIHDWIIKDALYDDSHSLPNTNNVYGAIIQKNCVCIGYALAFKYVSDMAGLNVVFITGDALSGDSTLLHSWNYAYLDNQWFLVDVTWDRALQSSNASHRYLLLSPESEYELGTTRTCEDKLFVYPQ